jgi:hypothetical protein
MGAMKILREKKRGVRQERWAIGELECLED